jgi:Ca-activated chloride channel family protein
MKTRIAPSTLETFGLFAIIESKRVVLPLKGVECDFSVVSGIAEVSITQIFRQENDRALDCEYLFPLPADASVYACEADINGRAIRAQVRERNEARQIAAEKKAAGFRTALVEAERENLFTLSLGNIQPNDLIIIQLKYFQTLRSLGETRSVEIPFCPGVRYIPGSPLLRSNRGKGVVDDTDQVPDASRITPVRIDALHPDAAYIEVRGTLDGKFVAGNSLVSPSHPIAIHPAGNELRLTLSDKGDIPNRDFVLRWTERDAETVAPRAWVHKNNGGVYALMEVRAPKTASSQRAPVDFYFLVDRSGSMAGEKWNKAAEALQSCVRVLGSSDRAMITFFESQHQDFAEAPQLVGDLLSDRQFQTIQRLGTAGGTEMRPALKHVLDMAARHSSDRDKNLILITDAQIGNDSAILELMKTAPNLPVHCFGIDIALNDALLLALSRQQGGTFYSLNPRDDIQRAVTSLGATLGQPVLLDIQLPEGWELAEARIPNLYAGQIHYLSARGTTSAPLELTARNGSSERVQIQFEKQTAQCAAPYLHWCRSRIDRSMAEGNSNAAIALSVKSNLICPLTAFIAWDEAEKVTVANHNLVHPNMELAEDAGFCDFDAQTVGGRISKMARFCARPASGGPAAAAPAGLREKLSPDRGLLNRILHPFAGKSGKPDELDLKRELSDLCHRLGIPQWESLLKAIFDWIAEAKVAERERRINDASDLLREIRQMPSNIPLSGTVEEQTGEIRKRVLVLLNGFVAKQNIPAEPRS